MAHRPASRFGLITKPNEPRAVTVSDSIARWADAHGLALLVDRNIASPPLPARNGTYEEIVNQSDVLIVLGGDGTMIMAARLVAGRGTPVVGINLGWLGYLTEFAVEDAFTALDRVAAGDYELDARAMLDWELIRDHEQVAFETVLNDIVVNRSAISRIIEIDCRIDGRLITTYRGDGVIVATPTGSTAYNLAAGGPIIYPDTGAISIAPICPHTLTNRPIVLPDSVEITLQLMTREQEVMLTSDGQTGLPLKAGDSVNIEKSKKKFNMVKSRDRDYFQILRDKLKWSGR
ncbi:MAG TPA: NAD(+)/NADH kinase [Blastocatellia bacterium]|nr:NAD(+)/NADH kinase [Blastocatellia bacterium]